MAQAVQDQATEVAEAQAAPEPTAEEIAAQEAAEAERVARYEAFIDFIDNEVDIQPTDEATAEQTARVVELYTELGSDRSAKTKAKKYVTDKMQEVIASASDPSALDKARVLLTLSKDLGNQTATRSAAAEAKPVDPKQPFVDGYAALVLAVQIFGNQPPEGVDQQGAITEADAKVDTLQDDVKKYVKWTLDNPETRGDQPEVDALILTAAKLAAGKSAKVRKPSAGGGTRKASHDGPRRSIKLHIAQAMAQHPDKDFLTVSEIVNTKSDEYGDDAPSSGAVAASIDSALRRDSKEIGGDAAGLYGTTSPNKGVSRTAPTA